MTLLALDTTLDACSVAVAEGARLLAARSEPMSRGHQERLAPMAAEAMAKAGLAFDALERIAVTVGPGSFTGVRVGLAFAKALALALDVPCVGVGTLEALAGLAPGLTVAAIDARRDQLYVQAFRDGAPLTEPAVLDTASALARVRALSTGEPLRLVGSGAPILGSSLPEAEIDPRTTPAPAALAEIAAAKPAPDRRPTPLYLRAPDARTIAEREARTR